MFFDQVAIASAFRVLCRAKQLARRKLRRRGEISGELHPRQITVDFSRILSRLS
jgi:hypothetical protein